MSAAQQLLMSLNLFKDPFTWSTGSTLTGDEYQFATTTNGAKVFLATTHKYGTTDTGKLYLSNDYGASWAQTGASADWSSVSASSDGTKMLASVNNGPLYSSTDGGVTLTARESARTWRNVLVAPNGSRMFATPSLTSTPIYISTDNGVTWTTSSPGGSPSALSCSSDGMLVIVGCSNNAIQRSTDGGVTWTTVLTVASTWFSSTASSADGSKLYASVNGVGIYRSHNSGATWTLVSLPVQWQLSKGLACSADGMTVVGVPYSEFVYLSLDAGVSWNKVYQVKARQACAISGDGKRVYTAIRSTNDVVVQRGQRP